jgi:hypothetical protein
VHFDRFVSSHPGQENDVLASGSHRELVERRAMFLLSAILLALLTGDSPKVTLPELP